MTMIELAEKGGPVVYVLAAYSVVGLAIVLERWLYFLRLPRLSREVQAGLRHLLDAPDALARTQALQGPEGRVLHALAEAASQRVTDLRAVGMRVRDEELKRMEAGLATVGILGNTAPLWGLFGTITGMIQAFMVIEQAGGKVHAQALAGGIWEAMITTGVGLAVAIPLVILLHFLEGMVERRVHGMDDCLALALERRAAAQGAEGCAPHHWEGVTDGL